MLTGTVQVVEYSLGVQIMNHVAIYGFQKSILYKIAKNISVLGIVLFLTLSIVNAPFNRQNIDEYLMKFPTSIIYDQQKLTYVFFIILFLSGSYQLLSRILLGLQRNATTQLVGLSGYVTSSAIMYIYMQLDSSPSYWIVYAVGLSPIAISFIPAIYLVSRIKPTLGITIPKISKEFTGFQYGVIFLIVSVLSTFNVYFPRIMTDLSGLELTSYLLTFTIVGIFMNISSSLSQLLWVENLKSFPSRGTILRRYRRAILATLASFPIFVSLSLSLYAFYSKLEVNAEMWTLIGLAFLFLLLQNIHLITSSLIMSKRDLIIASSFLIIQNLLFIFFSKEDKLEFTAALYLVFLITSSLLINYIPAILLVKRKIVHYED